MANFLFPDKNIFLPENRDFLEVARYTGYSKIHFPDAEIFSMIKSACEKIFEVLSPKAIFEEFDLKISKNGENSLQKSRNSEISTQNSPENANLQNPNDADFKISVAGFEFFSKDLAQNLKNCATVYLTAATLGPQVDSVIRREQILNPAMAVVLQSAGAMFAEKLVDYANSAIKDDARKRGKTTKTRFSPGYGDIPLEVQKIFFRLLPCAKIGLTLTDSLIMAPEKSVTAFVGSFDAK